MTPGHVFVDGASKAELGTWFVAALLVVLPLNELEDAGTGVLKLVGAGETDTDRLLEEVVGAGGTATGGGELGGSRTGVVLVEVVGFVLRLELVLSSVDVLITLFIRSASRPAASLTHILRRDCI